MFSVLAYLVIGGALLSIWRHGARPEQLAALTLAGSTFADLAYHALLGAARYASIDLGHLAIGTTCLAVLLALALHANRVWPLWCCALQLIMSLGHIGEVIYPRGAPVAYWAMTSLPTLGQVVAVLLGTIAHARRIARIGPYRAWRIA